MKVALVLFGLVFSSLSFAEEIEICLSSGECSLRVHAEELSGPLHLVKADDAKVLRGQWAGPFMVVSPEDYAEIRELVPESMTFRAKGGSKPAGSAGPLVSGTITVTVGGAGGCSDCHTGSLKEIHKKVIKPDSSK